ncbi:MAG: peptidoglycan hydrolase-like protein with peptidoglycan-binding domain [Actinomycetes bacterium]|jgi:peptidoglycan hydrolase-like protein with peptidoglycan-binding domain
MGEPTSKAKRKLKKGMKGKDVKRLQRALQMKKKQRNGRYRSSTAKAVTSWKRANGLRPNARASVGFQRKLGL